MESALNLNLYGKPYTLTNKSWNIAFWPLQVDGKAVVEKVLISVKGGDPASVSAMKARINTDGWLNAETYQNWARSIANHPSLLYSEVQLRLIFLLNQLLNYLLLINCKSLSVKSVK